MDIKYTNRFNAFYFTHRTTFTYIVLFMSTKGFKEVTAINILFDIDFKMDFSKLKKIYLNFVCADLKKLT